METARFAGKPVLRVPVSQALKDPEMLLHRALSGTAPLEPEDESVPGMGCNRKAGSAKDGAAATQEFGRKLYTDLMNGVSHMIPFITGGGILIALSYFWTAVMRAQKCSGGERPLPCWCARLVIPHLI